MSVYELSLTVYSAHWYPKLKKRDADDKWMSSIDILWAPTMAQWRQIAPGEAEYYRGKTCGKFYDEKQALAKVKDFWRALTEVNVRRDTLVYVTHVGQMQSGRYLAGKRVQRTLAKATAPKRLTGKDVTRALADRRGGD